MINKMALGFFSPLQGFSIIFSSAKNMGFALIPFVIGIVVVGAGFFVASEYLNEWVQGWFQGAEWAKDWPWLSSVVNALLLVVAWLMAAFLNFLAAYIVIIVVAGPFYALMVENIFKKELPDKEERSNFKLALNMFVVGLAKVLIFAVIGIIGFIMIWIPLLNLLAPVLAVLVVAFDCSDYAFEVDFLNLRERFQFFSQHFSAFLGLALAVMLTNLIPGLFFVLLPVFICGASKMYIQLSRAAV